jgi:hypothetical protein
MTRECEGSFEKWEKKILTYRLQNTWLFWKMYKLIYGKESRDISVKLIFLT